MNNHSSSNSRQFASDNRSGICPEAWDALARANVGHAPSYGDDPFTAQAADLLARLFETKCEIYFTATGTAANSLAIASFCESYHSIICHHESHIETDECSAPAYFAHGIKLTPAGGRGDNGKLTPDTIEKIANQRRDIHSSKPRLVSLSQSTELGTLYHPRELKAISKVTRKLGLGLHMDGARFANAVAATGCSPAELSWKSGIDVLCFGGTKNGMSCGEAIIFFDKTLAADFAYRRKQAGQLLSKMRFLSAQWIGMLEDGMDGPWLRHATHSNSMARRLEAGLRKASVKILFPVEANAIFVQMSPESQARLHKRGWEFYNFMTPDCVRFMCSWDTTESDIARLLADVSALPKNGRPSSKTRRSPK